MIVVRTHGGLGNQLFQVAQALVRERALEAGPVRRLHDDRYKVKRAPSPAFADLDGPIPTPLAMLSALRVPKVLKRSQLVDTEVLHLGQTLLLDGYFQRASDWSSFPGGLIAGVIHDFRSRFGIEPARNGTCLVHLRLGDFFASEADELSHLRARLQGVPEGATVITDRDDLLAAHASDLSERHARHLPTANLSPETLLGTMAGFSEIRSNDSTIGFWAALLGGGKVTLTLPRLVDLMAALRPAAG